MSDSLISKTEALCVEAWAAVEATPEYAAFKALETAAKAMRRRDIEPAPRLRVRPVLTEGLLAPRRVSQGDAAEAVLRETHVPMMAVALIEAAREKGASIGGEKPMLSFTSTLSKDSRFFSFRHGGNYFWWLTDVSLPEGWGEAADDLPFGTAASDTNSQEGGDGP